MKKLSELAKDYLADCDVLTEARNQFEGQLAEWWSALLPDYVIPSLTMVNQGRKPESWENNSQPGMCQWWAADVQGVYLELQDPRRSNSRYYTVRLRVGSQPALKELTKQNTLVGRLDECAREWKVCGPAGLKWTHTTLAKTEIEILADDPEATARQVSDVAERYFRVVVDHHLATSNTPKL